MEGIIRSVSVESAALTSDNVSTFISVTYDLKALYKLLKDSEIDTSEWLLLYTDPVTGSEESVSIDAAYEALESFSTTDFYNGLSFALAVKDDLGG